MPDVEPGRAAAGVVEHARRPKDELGQWRRYHRPAQHGAAGGGHDLGEVVRGPCAGDDDPVRRGKEVAGVRRHPAGRVDGRGNRVA